jgi:hypothetical protein
LVPAPDLPAKQKSTIANESDECSIRHAAGFVVVAVVRKIKK